MAKYLDQTGLQYVITKIDGQLEAKANLSDFNTLSGKVDGILEVGGQPNVIETVKLNGTALTVTDKAVDIDLSAYATTQALNEAIAGAVESVMHYKGTVAAFANLPTEGQVLGDVYNVTDTGANYAWNGTGWDELSGIVDLSAYSTTEQVNSLISTAIAPKADKTYVDGEVETLEVELAKKAVASEVEGALALKANAANVYTKGEADNLLADKANSADVYTKAEVDAAIDADVKVVSDALSTLEGKVYTKTEIDSKVTTINESIATKADASTLESEVSALETEIAKKVNTSDLVAITNAEIDAMF